MLLKGLLTLFFSLSFASFGETEELTLPRLGSPVVDQAHLFSRSVVNYVESELHRLLQQGGPQIQILTVESTEGLSIEQYSIKIMEHEKIGNEKRDDGLLFLISAKDRKMRIEVGQGLEGSLPDVNAKRIISDIIKPFFRKGDMDGGLIQGLMTITSQVAPEFSWTPINGQLNSKKSNKRPTELKDSLLILIFIILYLIFSGIFRGRGRGFRRDPFSNWGGGGWGSGKGWGGGSGSGSWGGGGGGFSGGGASGDW